MITMGPTLLLFTWLSKEKELIAKSNKEPQFYCNNKAAYMTSIHVYIIVFFKLFASPFSFSALSNGHHICNVLAVKED